MPRTGIEYPFAKENRDFIKTHKEFELLSEMKVPPMIQEEYFRNDMERSNALPGAFPIVYDCIEPSPYYELDDPNDQFIDERDVIELPNP